MNLAQCPQGHFYDGDRYSECPHCARENGTSVPKNDGPTSPLGGCVIVDPPPTGNGTMVSCPKGHLYDSSQHTTCPICAGELKGNGGITVPYGHEPIPEPVPESGDNKEDVTIFLTPEGVMTSPVVGWLVCVKGEDAGKDYPLHTDKNFIGRAANSDICLSKDKAVSRDRHAIIIYEPRGNVFFAQPGESSKLYYINGQVVLGNVELHAYDRISLGETELVFVPFCGEHFMWKNPEE